MSKPSFIRFQTALRCPQTSRRLGLFQVADQIREDFLLAPEYRIYVDEIYTWFNDNLLVPTLKECD